jgi:hypothetical protein
MNVSAYREQKSINLALSHQSRAIDSAANIDRSAAFLWQQVYQHRLGSIIGDRCPVPTVFPGQSAIIGASKTNNFAFDRYSTFVENDFFGRSFDKIPATASRQIATAARQIERYGHDGRSALPQLERLFHVIHQAWADVPLIVYDEDALQIAHTFFKGTDRRHAAPVLFELEEFASYCSLRSRLNLTGNGIYQDNWLDVGCAQLTQLRASEKCKPERLLQEICNIAQGHTAPIVVNEFGCVADGNHRLTAAWIWNALHHCRDTQWQLDNSHFQTRLAQFAGKNTTDTTRTALANAMAGLSALLANPDLLKAVEANAAHLKRGIVVALPVVPQLSYNSLAVDAALFDENGSIVRFDPANYKILQNNPGVLLPTRACYHFADRVPMPWFSVVRDCGASPVAGKEIKRLHQCW